MKTRSIAVALLLSTTLYAQAQPKASLLPLVQDIPVGDGLGGKKIDIAGIQFGETRENALAILGKLHPAAKPQADGVEISLSDQRGNAVSFDYNNRATLSHREGDMEETMVLDFTTALTGGRVYAIRRQVRYLNGKFGNLTELRAGIRQKYGEPTVVELALHQGRIDIEYTYETRPVRRFGEYDIRSGTDASRQNVCLGITRFRIIQGEYKLVPEARREPCVATIKFTIFIGQNEQTFRSMEVEALDYSRGATDTRLLDAAMKKAVDDKAKSIVGTGAPRL